MKIGILTFHFSDNFGAVLQAYALRLWFIRHGHEANFINYHPDYIEKGGNFENIINLSGLKKNVKVAYLKYSNIQRKFFGNKSQASKFENFRKKYLGISGEEFKSVDALVNIEKYDLLVAGSDQIWNPSGHVGLDPAYFLYFSSEFDIPKISYAASFGKDNLDKNYHENAKKMLQQLTAISVREESGVSIVKNISGCDAVCVPDPTFLNDDYSELISQSNEISTNHIFCYALRTSDGIRDVAHLISKEFNAPIFSPYNVHRRWREIGSTVFPGPADWLKLLINSKYIVTNSFHATVFAILYKKPFLVVGLPGSRAGLNARAKNLLAKLGLSDRYIDSTDVVSVNSKIKEKINWEEVNNCRQAMKLQGEIFLQSQLNNLNK